MSDRVLVLSGGVGGAKLALGFYHCLPLEHLTVLVNTGDDFNHYGLQICPDIDTVLYTLANVANPKQGWGRANESWACLETLAELGGETWFQLGDKDLALHLVRGEMIRSGLSLTECTAQLVKHLGIAATILPMSDQPVATELETNEGRLAFQEYFVKRRCEPAVQSLHYTGAEQAATTPALRELLADSNLAAIIIAPSNPFLSIAPMLEIPGFRELLRESAAPLVAVTPVLGDAAVKGPTTKIMRELALPVSARSVRDFYAGLIDGFVIDQCDSHLLSDIDGEVMCTNTLMKTNEDKTRLAREVLAFAKRLPRS